jgi:DNA gyrase inhibitor GyrI
VIIENIPNCRFAYMRRTGKYGPENKETMENLKEWAKSKHLFDKKAVIYGIAQDNSETTKPDNCRYDACIVIPQDFIIDTNVDECEFSSGKYAVFEVTHTSEDIQKAYIKIPSTLSKEGLKYANKPILERYTVEMVKNHLCEICVPIE